MNEDKNSEIYITEYAPIAMFVYKRLSHTKETIAALKNNPCSDESDLYVFSDGPRKGDEEEVQKLREYIHSVVGFRNVYIIERETNFGLAKNIVSGVSEIVEKFKKVIVIEDDIVVAPGFLNYMNDALEMYRNEQSVMCVSGYSALTVDRSVLPSAFFLKGRAECWGWGTWDRAWKMYEKNPGWCIRNIGIKEAIRFDKAVGEPVYDQIMLNYLGKMNTWAVFWDYTVFKNDGLCLCVRDSLVTNTGFDGSGEHCGDEKHHEVMTDWTKDRKIEFPNDALTDDEILKNYYSCLKKHNNVSVLRLMISRVRWLLLFFECKVKSRV